MFDRAIIVDIDGTLADNTHRQHLYNEEHKDWSKINEASRYDTLNQWCIEIVRLFSAQGYKIIFLTGRSSDARDVTSEWLTANVGPGIDYELIMRPASDYRRDDIFKRSVYLSDITPRYNVLFAIDDRVPVTLMWRDLGLTCLACADNH